MAKLNIIKKQEKLLKRLEENHSKVRTKYHSIDDENCREYKEYRFLILSLSIEMTLLRRWLMNETIDPEVGLFCNWILYSDVEPFKIISISPSGKTLTIRGMDADLNPDFKCNTQIGGFGGHTLNNYAQSYTYKSNKDGEIRKVSKTKKGWTRKSLRYRISETPCKFYDYNF